MAEEKKARRIQNANLTPGSPGRKKGVPNKRTIHAADFAQQFTNTKAFKDAIKLVVEDPTHEHWQWTVELVMAYAYGKPVERKEIDVDAEQTIEVVDFRSVFVGAVNGEIAEAVNGETPA